MNGFWKAFTTSVGKKLIVAVTGTVLVAFVFVHMLGNLQIFLGHDAINHYAEFLKTNRELLWPTRIILVLCVTVHVITALMLAIENCGKRGTTYEVKKIVGATYASRTMIISGPLILCFATYHLLHFTTGTTNPEFLTLQDADGRQDVYRMMLVAFSDQWFVGGYLLGVGVLSYHLSKGIGAMFQSVGFRHESHVQGVNQLSRGLAWVLFIGFVSTPMAVLLGVLK